MIPHQINPPQYIPVVEVISAPWTEQSVVEHTVSLMRDLGQAPIVAKKEVNGFIVNRLQYALIMEAWRLVEVRVMQAQDGHRCALSGVMIVYFGGWFTIYTIK